MVNRPPSKINQMMGLKNRMANILPASPMLKNLPFLQLDLRQLPLSNVSVLVQLHRAPAALREVAVGDAAGELAVDGVVVDGGEFEGEEEGAVGLRGLAAAVGGEDWDPLVVDWGGDKVGDRDGGGADELGAENVVVLDVEEEVGGEVGEGDGESLVPMGVLGVGDDAGAGDSGGGDGDGDVGVAGDDLLVRVVRAAGGVAG